MKPADTKRTPPPVFPPPPSLDWTDDEASEPRFALTPAGADVLRHILPARHGGWRVADVERGAPIEAVEPAGMVS